MIVETSLHTSQSDQRTIEPARLSNESLQTSQVSPSFVDGKMVERHASVFKSRSTPPLHPISTPPCEAAHLGQIVRAYRIKNDIGTQQFAATVGRSPSWLADFEKSGTCLERTEFAIYHNYPSILKIVLGQA